MTTATDNIAYITISGTVSNFFGIDNLIFCTEEQPLGACCFRDNSCALLNEQSCQGAGGIWTANTPCEQIDCEVLPTEESTWGRIKALFKE